MKNKIKILLIMASLITLSGNCDSIIGNDDKLSIKRENYNGNELRTDGYYYRVENNYINSAYFFYKNGIILINGIIRKSHNYTQKYITDNYINDDFYKGDKTSWGVFKIEGGNIQYEQWYAGDRPHKAYVMSGVILNDTTFYIKESWRSNGSEHDAEDKIYHFKQFSPKPDSTNSFIK